MKSPPLDSWNRFEGLKVDEMDSDTDTDDTLVDSSVHNSRGSQLAELSAPEVCLIPCESEKVDQKPKEGVKEHYFIRSAKMERDVKLDVSITMMDTHDMVAVKGLLDNRATGMFIDRQFMHRNGLKTRILPYKIKVYNVDRTLNKGGSITEEVTMMMSHKGHKEKVVFEVCDLGKAVIIIGLLWLQKHNLEINWKTGVVKMTRCPPECNVFIRAARRERK